MTEQVKTEVGRDRLIRGVRSRVGRRDVQGLLMAWLSQQEDETSESYRLSEALLESLSWMDRGEDLLERGLGLLPDSALHRLWVGDVGAWRSGDDDWIPSASSVGVVERSNPGVEGGVDRLHVVEVTGRGNVIFSVESTGAASVLTRDQWRQAVASGMLRIVK